MAEQKTYCVCVLMTVIARNGDEAEEYTRDFMSYSHEIAAPRFAGWALVTAAESDK